MSYRRVLKALVPIALVASAVFAPGLLANEQQSWQVVVASNAFISHGTSTTFEPAVMGDSVGTGDRLTTRSGGALVVSRGEDLITLAENT
jgi:hypothetical protein